MLRLRAAGCVLVGTTVMTEFGVTPLGWSAHWQVRVQGHCLSAPTTVAAHMGERCDGIPRVHATHITAPAIQVVAPPAQRSQSPPVWCRWRSDLTVAVRFASQLHSRAALAWPVASAACASAANLLVRACLHYGTAPAGHPRSDTDAWATLAFDWTAESSMVHAGPLATSAHDLGIGYLVLAGSEPPLDPVSCPACHGDTSAEM